MPFPPISDETLRDYFASRSGRPPWWFRRLEEQKRTPLWLAQPRNRLLFEQWLTLTWPWYYADQMLLKRSTTPLDPGPGVPPAGTPSGGSSGSPGEAGPGSPGGLG